MNARPHYFLATNAQRREDLIARCAEQRLTFAGEVHSLLLPFASGGWKKRLGGRLRLPLLIAGGVLGLLMVRSKRALPLLTAGASAWKSAGALLPMVRSLTTRKGKRTGKAPR